MKKKNLRMTSVLMTAAIAMGALAGCGTTNEAPTNSETAASEENAVAEATVAENTETVTATENEQAASTEDSKADETGATEDSASTDASNSIFTKTDSSTLSAKDALKGVKSALPAYEYPGAEVFYYVMYDYIVNELGKGYLPGDVTIPCPIIVAEDDSDNSDLLVYGDFQVYNYTLSEDTLMTISGGSHPGLMHMKYADGEYEVTGFDPVLDGSDYEPSAKKIFGDYYDAFQKAESDDKAKEELRAQIISNYAAANELNINGYQDYGWEKIALPTENIDSFYSTY